MTAHFGHWRQPQDTHKPVWQIAADFVYGQVRKFQRHRRLVKVEHGMLCGPRETLIQRLTAAGLSGRLNTAYIERWNLTLRPGVALLTRRTWGTAQFTCELILHVSWWRADDPFARYHEALRVEQGTSRQPTRRPVTRRDRPRTPAMAAGLVARRWTVLELISSPLD